MTPAQIRQVAREEARRAVAGVSGGGVPSVWTNEVQVYNDGLAKQGVRTLRGLAEIVCGLQVASEDQCGGGPRGPERAFEFDGERLVAIVHGSELGSDAEVVVRRTTLHYDEGGGLESVRDTWTHEGRPWGRSVALSCDNAGRVALVVRTGPGPLELSTEDEETE